MPTSLQCRRGSWRSSAISSARRPTRESADAQRAEGERRPEPERERSASARPGWASGLGLALAVAALACAGATPWSTRTSPGEPAFRAAEALVESDPAGAEAALEAFLSDWPRSPRADDAAVLLARLRVARGDRAGASAVLGEAIRHQPRGDRVDAARLLLARLEREAGRPDEAYRVASAIRPSRLSAPERADAYRLLAEVAAARDDRAGQLRWLAQLAGSSKSAVEREATSREIDDVIFALDADRLASLVDQLGGQPPALRVELRRAQLALERGDLEGATRALDAASRLPADAAERARLESLGQHLRARARPDFGDEPLPEYADVNRLAPPSLEGAEGTLGVVLPLSGSFARFGEASLRGIVLAAGILDHGGSRVRLLVRDSRGDPGAAAAEVAELAADPEVMAVVGPLLSDSSEAAAVVAEREQIPLLSLAPRESIAAGRPHVFRLGTTPRSEVELVVEHATTRLGARRFAILHPRDSYGRGLKDLVWDAVEARGGEVVGVASYEPAATDFAESIRRLSGWLLLSEGERAALREREQLESKAKRLLGSEQAELVEKARAIRAPDGGPLPPLVDFDALFIADTHGRVELIAPQLAFHDVRGVRLLGASGWSHPDLVAIGGRHVEGAVFAESFHAGSRFDAVAAFRERYRAAFGGEPDASAAQAFDAASLVLVQLAQGQDERDAVLEGLHAVRGFPGASGVITIGSDGNAAKRPFLLGVRSGEIVPLD